LTWRPKFSIGGLLGLLFLLLLLAMDALLVAWLVNSAIRAQQIGFGTYFLGLLLLGTLPLIVVIAYHTVAWLTLRYHLDRNGLTIRWAGWAHVIPIRDIQRILRGSQLGGVVVRRRGVRWPGYVRGMGLVPGIGRTHFLASRPLPEQLIVVTPGMAFAISPEDLEGFLESYEARRELGPNRLLARQVHRAPWFEWPLWRDGTAWTLLGAALLVNLALFGYLTIRFPGLDFQLPLHFSSQGQVDRIGTKAELFALPIIGLIILGTNLILGLFLYRRERAGSYLLWGAAAAAQGLFWLATFSIVP
jgi:hypothetical protein